MGMFDCVRCDMELPDPPPKEVLESGYGHFQTKDFEDCYLRDIHITKDGRLLLDGEDLSFHGMLRFGTIGIDEQGQCDGRQWSYLAKFTDGKCVQITEGRDQ